MRALLKYRHAALPRTYQVQERLSQVAIAVHNQQHRCMHESYIPKGPGGRSSFSGIVATVFGATGFLGHAVVNHLGAMGCNVMIPYRGTGDRIRRMRVMSDLGQFQYREQFSIKQDDDVVRDLIEHSNCVINLIGARTPYNHYTMEEPNVNWPKRLARLVSEKNDGTLLIHVTNLNCHQEEGRRVSNILRQNHEAEIGMREIYPATTIIRSSNIHGFGDHYSKILLNKRFGQMVYTGSLPVLYDNGKSTITQPVFVADAAEGVARVTKHPDALGHTFEFVGPDRFTLHDFCEYIYNLTDEDFYDFDTIGPLDRSKANWHQKLLHTIVEFHFWKMTKPRLYLPRLFDMISREGSSYSAWMTQDFYKQLHITDRTTGAPGLNELGIVPSSFEEKAYEYLYAVFTSADFTARSGPGIPRAGPEVHSESENRVVQLSA